MKYKLILVGVILGAFLLGFYLRGVTFINDLFPPDFTCNQLARWHQDLLMEKYDIHDGFNTDQNNPRRDLNQKASDLNAKLLEVCNTDPTK